MSNPQAGGLFSQGNRVPLKGVSIDVKASGAAAQVTVSQRYKNTEKAPVEAVYSFPLEESCAVNGFEIEIGGKKVVGKIEEREKAFEKFDDAMAQGHGAFLVDQDRPNIFTASVGNLLPDQEAIVRLSYATELEQNGDTIRLLIPTTISPRYIPKEELKKIDPAELDHITPPTVAGGVPYGLKLNVELLAASDVREVSCASHPASVSIDGRTIRVELAGQNIQLDQDFVLNVRLAKPHEAFASVVRDGDGARAVMLNLFPDLKSFKRGACEFLFIVDRSGSMQGESIERARSALLLALRSLEEGDRFNVIGFGTSYETMFPESVVYNQKNLDEATQKVEAIRANLGGTELLAPLKFMLEAKASGEMPRQAILLTDGQVGNEAQCIALAAEHAGRCRIFTFGIGNGVSEFLVKGLARASGGQAEFIHYNERIEPKVLKQFARMSSAFLKNVRVDWGNLQTDIVAPSAAPQVFDGDRLTLYARVIGGTGGDVSVLADGPNGALKFPVTVDLERAGDNRAIPVLMARKAIQELEESGGLARGSSQADRKAKTVKSKVLELALRYQIMSSETSFVAVEERTAGMQTAAAELRRIPIALTKGWGGAPQQVQSSLVGSACMAAPMPPPMPCAAPGTQFVANEFMDFDLEDKIVLEEFELSPNEAAPPEGFFSRAKKLLRMDTSKKSKAPSKQSASSSAPGGGLSKQQASDPKAALRPVAGYELIELAKSQKADGGFELTETLINASSVASDRVEKAASDLGGDNALAKRIVATLLALKSFEAQYANRRDEWRMIADKAERWLAKQASATPKGFADLKAWSESVFK